MERYICYVIRTTNKKDEKRLIKWLTEHDIEYCFEDLGRVKSFRPFMSEEAWKIINDELKITITKIYGLM